MSGLDVKIGPVTPLTYVVSGGVELGFGQNFQANIVYVHDCNGDSGWFFAAGGGVGAGLSVEGAVAVYGMNADSKMPTVSDFEGGVGFYGVDAGASLVVGAEVQISAINENEEIAGTIGITAGYGAGGSINGTFYSTRIDDDVIDLAKKYYPKLRDQIEEIESEVKSWFEQGATQKDLENKFQENPDLLKPGQSSWGGEQPDDSGSGATSEESEPSAEPENPKGNDESPGNGESPDESDDGTKPNEDGEGVYGPGSSASGDGASDDGLDESNDAGTVTNPSPQPGDPDYYDDVWPDPATGGSSSSGGGSPDNDGDGATTGGYPIWDSEADNPTSSPEGQTTDNDADSATTGGYPTWDSEADNPTSSGPAVPAQPAYTDATFNAVSGFGSSLIGMAVQNEPLEIVLQSSWKSLFGSLQGTNGTGSIADIAERFNGTAVAGSIARSALGAVGGRRVRPGRVPRRRGRRERLARKYLQPASVAAFAAGGRRTLAPGMAVRVDIVTGERRLIEYLLAPVLSYQRESLRER